MGQTFSVTQYHVDFQGGFLTPGKKKGLMQSLQTRFGSFLFDGGSSLYLLNPLDMRGHRHIEFGVETRDKKSYTLRLRHARDIHFLDSNFLHILNVAVRDAISRLELKLVGRDYYDPSKKVSKHMRLLTRHFIQTTQIP